MLSIVCKNKSDSNVSFDFLKAQFAKKNQTKLYS